MRVTIFFLRIFSANKQKAHKSIHFYLTFRVHLIVALGVSKLRNIYVDFWPSSRQIKSSCTAEQEIYNLISMSAIQIKCN